MATSTPQDTTKLILEALAGRALTNAELLRVTTAIVKIGRLPDEPDPKTPAEKAKYFLRWLRVTIRQTAYAAEVRDAQTAAQAGISLIDLGEDE